MKYHILPKRPIRVVKNRVSQERAKTGKGLLLTHKMPIDALPVVTSTHPLSGSGRQRVKQAPLKKFKLQF